MRCYRCGKPATKFVNTAIGVAVTAASILESACDECWQKSHDATLTAALEEARGVLVASRSFVELVYEETDREEAADVKIVMGQTDAALATIDAALGRVEG